MTYYGHTLEGSGVMYSKSTTRIRDITDGTSNTLLLAENDIESETDPGADYCRSQGCFIGKSWTGMTMVTSYYGINLVVHIRQSGINSHHPGGVNFAFADGHVDFISETIDQGTLKALTTRAGGEVVDVSDLR